MTIREASDHFSVSKSTLGHQLKHFPEGNRRGQYWETQNILLEHSIMSRSKHYMIM